MNNQWDQLAETFGAAWDDDTIPACAADNIGIAWPSLLSCIEREFTEFSGLKALDFGCGGGLFCRLLSQLGFSVTGYDQSTELVKHAMHNTPDEVTITGSDSVMVQNGGYDLISSIMVLQFIEEIEVVIDQLVSLLKPDGLIMIAVFNPEFINDNLNSAAFSGFQQNGYSGYMALQDGVNIPVHNRNDATYRELFESRGLTAVYLDYPAFTREFLNKHEMPFSTAFPEYQIQGFRCKRT